MEEIEVEMTLIGATAIEDKLQVSFCFVTLFDRWNYHYYD